MRSVLFRAGLPLVLALIGFAAFRPALGNGFVNWDDTKNFEENFHYRGLGPENLRWMFTDYEGHYMPLTWITLGLDYILWGMDPTGYHLTNLLLHAANTAIFYFVLLLLLRHAAGDLTEHRRMWAAAAGTLFFAIHPLRVESVVWATERRDVLSGLFFLLTILTYLRAAPEGRRKWLWLSVLFFLCSLLSKMMGMTLPLVLLVLDWYPLRRIPGRDGAWKRVFAEKIPFIILMAAAVVATGMAQHHAGAMFDTQRYPPFQSVMQPPLRLSFYVWKMLVPVGLSPLYQYRPDESFTLYAMGFLGTAAMLVLVLWNPRRRPAPLAAWAAYVILLGPVIGIFQAGPHFAADRYTYLACMPWAALAAGIVAWAPLSPRLLAPVCAIVLATLGGLTWRQSLVWRDSFTLWDYALSLDNRMEMGYHNRGLARAKDKEDFKGAIADYDTALRIDSAYPEVLNDRGIARARMGDNEGAIADYTEAIRLRPDHAATYGNRGFARWCRKDYDGALADYDEALRRNPDIPNVHLNRGQVLAARGELDAAIAGFDTALRLNPFFPEAYEYRGTVRLHKGDRAGAAEDFRNALRLAPTDWPRRAAVEALLEKSR